MEGLKEGQGNGEKNKKDSFVKVQISNDDVIILYT